MPCGDKGSDSRPLPVSGSLSLHDDVSLCFEIGRCAVVGLDPAEALSNPYCAVNFLTEGPRYPSLMPAKMKQRGLRRQIALTCICPKCGAGVGEPCAGAHGPRKSHHIQRYKVDKLPGLYSWLRFERI